MADSKQLRNRIEEVIHNGGMDLDDLVKLFEYLGNDILQAKTRTIYGKSKGKCYNSHQFAKGPRTRISGVEFIVDCE